MSAGEIYIMFSADNPCNTTCTDGETGDLLYTVKTEHTPKKSTTYVRDPNGTVLATNEWREIRSDVITLGSTPSFSSGSWLRKSVLPFKNTVYMTHNGHEYKWKGNNPGMALELYDSTSSLEPIARFHRPRHNDTPACLILNARGADLMDMAVISFLFLEKRRRTSERAMEHRMVIAAPHSGLGGMRVVQG